MTKVCPYCAGKNVKRVWDGLGDVDWCQDCHRTWLVPDKTGRNRNESYPKTAADLMPPQDE
jgi:transposase-like protein